MQVIRKMLRKKARGNATSLILGQMFMLLLIIWCLFNFKLKVLNTTFNYIDDALLSSLLGGALVDIEEYGKSNQLIIYGTEGWIDDTTGSTEYMRWRPYEADILLSELNEGSDVTMDYNALETKTVVDMEKRAGTKVDYKWQEDEYLRRSVSAVVGNLTYNLSNGRKTNTIDTDHMISDVSGIQARPDINTIPSSVINTAFLKNYVTTPVNITRFDLYNVYRTNFAKYHWYRSEWLTWNSAHTSYSWNIPSNEADFMKWYEKTYTTYNKNNKIPPKEDENYGAWLQAYERKKARWEVDLKVKQSGQPLTCYTNTQTTYQGAYKKDKYTYADGTLDKLYALNGTIGNCVVGERSPINSYGILSYRNSGSQFNYVPNTTYTLKSNISGNEKWKIQLQDGKMNGADIDDTALYIEITFSVNTLPKFIKGLQVGKYDDHQVTLSRLIDIELRDE